MSSAALRLLRPETAIVTYSSTSECVTNQAVMTGRIECTITSRTFVLGQRIKDRKIGVQYEAPPFIGEFVNLFGYATQPGAERTIRHYHGTFIVPARQFQNRKSSALDRDTGLCNISRIEPLNQDERERISAQWPFWDRVETPKSFK